MIAERIALPGAEIELMRPREPGPVVRLRHGAISADGTDTAPSP